MRTFSAVFTEDIAALHDPVPTPAEGIVFRIVVGR